MSQYESLEIYGPNLTTVEGAEWKRHRSVANPAFSEVCTTVSDSGSQKKIDPIYQPNNALVWSETCRIVDEWFSEIDDAIKSEQKATVDLLNDLAQVKPFLCPPYHPSLITR